MRGQTHTIAAAELLANDHRLGSQGALHISVVDGAVGGSVSLTEQGDVAFSLDPAYNAVPSFKYTLVDDAGNPAGSVVDLHSGALAPMRASVSVLSAELPNDPMLAQQWYLSDINVLPVWADYSGKGVRIGQFEPGGQYAVGPEILDVAHPDLSPNVDAAWLQAQRNDGTLPALVSNHATMVAGVMVAARNELGGIGVAYDASVGGHYLANSGQDLAGLGKMLGYDIANHSWGFSNDFALSNLTGGSITTASAIMLNAQYAAANGRGGLGTVSVTAGGNHRAEGGSAQGSLTNNNRFAIQVGAVNAQGDLSTLQAGAAPFSNPGSSLLVSAPGSNVASTSVQLVTEAGSTVGNAYSASQGTSFAAPIVSGIAALMLQANPGLGYRDIQQILALSARKIDDATTTWADNGAKNWNGGGMHASIDYGFGTVDARAAVRLAESWMARSTADNERVLKASSGLLGNIMQAGETLSPRLSLPAGVRVEHVEVDIDAQVGRLGDLVVSLVSPDGTQSVLLDRVGKAPASVASASDADGGSTRSGEFKYTFMSTHAWGEDSPGEWSLNISNASSGLPVTLNTWSLRLYGAEASNNDAYFYSDEYAAALIAQPGRAVLDDALNGTPGGRNTFNAAAVSGDVWVDLPAGSASIAGAALSISNGEAIHNLITGDGNDTLVAGPLPTLLDGGRGQNSLTGGGGQDLFVIHRRASGGDTLLNLDPAGGEVINLVGFVGKQYSDLQWLQEGSDVRIGLGDSQYILVKNQLVESLGENLLRFQDTFSAPAAYLAGSDASAAEPDITAAPGTVLLGGGSAGVSMSFGLDGEMSASLAGTVYSRDGETPNTFVVQRQDDVSSYKNAVRGFRQGVDKIDLSQTNVTDFSQLTIAKQERGTINGIALIHGVEVSIEKAGLDKPVQLLYLDALELSQLSAADFVFAAPLTEQAPVEALKVSNLSAEWAAGDFIMPTADSGSEGPRPMAEARIARSVDSLVQAMAGFAPQTGASLNFSPNPAQTLEPQVAVYA